MLEVDRSEQCIVGIISFRTSFLCASSAFTVPIYVAKRKSALLSLLCLPVFLLTDCCRCGEVADDQLVNWVFKLGASFITAGYGVVTYNLSSVGRQI